MACCRWVVALGVSCLAMVGQWSPSLADDAAVACARWKLEVGREYCYSSRREMRVVGDRGRATWILSWKWSFNVLEKDSYGHYTVKVLITSLEGTYSKDRESAQYTSDSGPALPESDHLRPFAAIVGEPFTISVGEDGSVLDTTGVKEILVRREVADRCAAAESISQALGLLWATANQFVGGATPGTVTLMVHLPPVIRNRPEVTTWLRLRRPLLPAKTAEDVLALDFECEVEMPVDPKPDAGPKNPAGGTGAAAKGNGGMSVGAGGPKKTDKDPVNTTPKHGVGQLRFSNALGALERFELKGKASSQFNNKPCALELVYLVERQSATETVKKK